MCASFPVSTYVMVENTAAVPQTALPRVNQSAKWNSRIMEKGFRAVRLFINASQNYDVVCIISMLNGAVEARVVGKVLAAHRTLRQAPLHRAVEHMPEYIAIAKAAMPIL